MAVNQCVNKNKYCGECGGQRNLCAISDSQWDVFIAYYGGSTKGTQTQAELLYDFLNNQKLMNGHALKVYQHTRINREGSYGITPTVAKNSSIFILLVDSDIPTDNNSAIAEFDANGRKPLYDEVAAFTRSNSRNIPCLSGLPYCSIIVCDDLMTDRSAEDLHQIFQERAVLRWDKLLKENFKSLLSAISYVLIGNKNLPTDKEPNNEAEHTFDNLPVGKGAYDRLLRINGQSVPYECLIQGDFTIDFSKEQFKPVNDVEHDCNCILNTLKNSSSRSDEANAAIEILDQIEHKKRHNKNINRVCHLDNLNGNYAVPKLCFQPIAYDWMLRMDMLDIPFTDKTGATTTLRKKYANPVEQSSQFNAEQMKLASHTGCGAFIITKDGYLICSNRRPAEERRLAFFPGRHSYTISGSYICDDANATPSDFMMDKIERELKLQDFTYTLIPWEFGYEYEHLHYQFSFFAFYNGDKDTYINNAKQTTEQAKSFTYYNLCDNDSLKKLANALRQPENWESAAWAMLSCALTSRRFKNKIRSMCNINFDTQTFYDLFSSNSNIE